MTINKETLIGVGLLAFTLGLVVCYTTLAITTHRVTSRGCDDIIHYPNGDIICEVEMHSVTDDITIIENR
jgi:hypothetical protein